MWGDFRTKSKTSFNKPTQYTVTLLQKTKRGGTNSTRTSSATRGGGDQPQKAATQQSPTSSTEGGARAKTGGQRHLPTRLGTKATQQGGMRDVSEEQ